jgi:hypothetical protein
MAKKKKTVNIMDYLVAKDGKTKYLKIQCSPKADDETKKLVEDLKALIGGDVLFVNLFDDKFREEYEIPDFAKGKIALPSKEENEAALAPAKSAAKRKDGGVNF